jgi:hypothetical protein
MRGALFVVAVAGAFGCSDGIFIEVTVPSGVDTVELVIGDRPCADPDGNGCSRIQPPGFDRDLGEPEDLFFRSTEEDNFFVARVDGGQAEFQLEVDAGRAQIIVLGRSSSDPDRVVAAALMQPIDLIESPVRYEVTLFPAEPLEPETSGAEGTVGVATWRNPETGVLCAGIDDHSTTTRGPVFVLPESDPDCDGVRRECDPLDHLAATEPDLTRPPNCARPEVENTEACVLGRAACDEALAQPLTCTTTLDPVFCVGTPVCTKCAQKGPFGFGDCARDILALNHPDALPAHFECPLEVEENADGFFVACDNGAERPLLVGAEGVPVRECLEASLASLAEPVGAFAASLEHDTGDGHAIQLALAAPIVPLRCDFELVWSGAASKQAVRVDQTTAVLGGLAAGDRLLIYPIKLRFVEGCTLEPKRCTFEGGDGDKITTCGL